MNWKQCKNILCIRADNMGDVLMSTPAFRALKNTFDCRLTLLTSKMGSVITPFIKEIDETIIADFPWIKTNNSLNNNDCFALIEKLKNYQFDAAIIFTVYSQNPLPSALIAYMANIPLRLAYCRENPYLLLTHWLPDKEPYEFIQHQVQRDLKLVQSIGATTNSERLSIFFNEDAFETAMQKLRATEFDSHKKYIVAHAGVSEIKREYPVKLWIEAINLIQQQTDMQIVLTGTTNEEQLTKNIQQETGSNVFCAAGLLTIEEFIAVIAHSEIVISVNTSTLHIAAALQKKVIALYAQTNPQHTPWQTKNVVLPYNITATLKSRNEVVRFVDKNHFNKQIDYPLPYRIAKEVLKMINQIKLVTESL